MYSGDLPIPTPLSLLLYCQAGILKKKKKITGAEKFKTDTVARAFGSAD